MASRILVVDDDELTRTLLGSLLAREGLEVELCADAASALERLEQASFSWLLTDYVMGGMNGLALVWAARALRPGIRCAVISGYTKAPVEGAEGVACWLPKPVDIDRLMRLLAS